MAAAWRTALKKQWIWGAGGIAVDHRRCTLCGKCVELCLKNAMKVTGIRMSIDEVYDIINRSRGFWTRMPAG